MDKLISLQEAINSFDSGYLLDLSSNKNFWIKGLKKNCSFDYRELYKINENKGIKYITMLYNNEFHNIYKEIK